MSAKGLRCSHYAQKPTSGLDFSTSALCPNIIHQAGHVQKI
jgi:hypothetical protein